MVPAFLFLVVLSSPQDEYTITAAFREAPDAGGGKRPALVCEGTTNLPNRARLDLVFFFDDPKLRVEMGRDAIEVREGRFSCEVGLYTPPRNLAGLHSARVVFDPHLQRPGLQQARRIQVEARLQAGSPDDAENDRRTWGRKLVGEIEAMTSPAEAEAQARYIRDKAAGKHDRKEWDRFIGEAEERTHEILHRVVRVPEYKALRFGDGADVGLEELRDLTLHYIRSCLRVLNNPNDLHGPAVLREAWNLLKRSKQKKIHSVFPPQGDAKLLTGLGEEALKVLKDSMEADEKGRARAWSKFRETIVTLDSRAPGTFHEAIIGLAAEAAPFFEALGADREKARPLLEALERRFQEIFEDFKKMK